MRQGDSGPKIRVSNPLASLRTSVLQLPQHEKSSIINIVY